MADIMGSIPIVSSLGNVNWITVAVWVLVFFFLIVGVLSVIFFLIYKKRYLSCYEIDLTNKRFNRFNAKRYKDKTGCEKLWVRKYKKYIGMPQQTDYFYKGRKDVLFFIKDNNGFLHTTRFLNKEEMVLFYKEKGIDITEEFIMNENQEEVENPYYKHYQIFTMPSPHEDLDWLGKEIDDSNKEFKTKFEWWQSPSVMMIGTAFICMIMFILTLVLGNK